MTVLLFCLLFFELKTASPIVASQQMQLEGFVLEKWILTLSHTLIVNQAFSKLEILILKISLQLQQQ